ncbi:MAG TPA: helicase C-terminal domain-containing protein, partial [Dehalococcoidia bacterium]|nr:helicase C-terminal domain-containing protein [Dehalococcoidia bacterium]
GDAAIVGQNVAFDLAFLARKGLVPPGPVFDTAELARVLLWDSREFSLRALAAYFGFAFPVRHRALPDAEMAMQVFLALRERALGLDNDVLVEVTRLASASPWPAKELLAGLLAERTTALEGGPAQATNGRRLREAWPSLVPCEETRPVDEADVIATLARGIDKAQAQGFERRPQQEQMASAVARALSEGSHLLVEAGTGTGKSLAYLVPAALFALRNQMRVVLSTNTIALQEQLVDKDIVLLRDMLDPSDRAALRVTQLKGRRNYLCLRRWAGMRHGGPYTSEEAKLLARLAVWLPHTQTGDRAELNLTQAEEAVWSRVAAQEDCGPSCVAAARGGCYVQQARRRAEGAHLLIVNHALLLSDLATGGHLLPEYDHLVIDEAHHLEDEATSQFGFEASHTQVATYLDKISAGRGGAAIGLAGRLRGIARAASGEPLGQGALAGIGSTIDAMIEDVADARQQAAQFFAAIRSFVREHSEAPGDYETRLLVTSAVRRQPAWADVEIAWDAMSTALHGVIRAIEHASISLSDASALVDVDVTAVIDECTALIAEGTRLREGIASIVGREDVDRIVWLTSSESGTATVQSAPLHTGDILRETLFEQRRSVILTGATLATSEGFHYVRERLGLDDGRELLLGAPFDYRSSALVLVPSGIPEPGQPGYQRAVEQAIIALARASGGRALVLLTSHAAVRATAAAIRPALEAEQILVLAHGIDGSPRQLIATLRENSRTVVLGTASFWEGVDVVGDALSLLIIGKLPFAVPTDPVFAARSEQFDEPFSEYALPQAILKFRQGFGRLIRRRTDRGVLVVLDRRVRSRQYGQAFLDALPDCIIEERRPGELAARVQDWLCPKGE